MIEVTDDVIAMLREDPQLIVLVNKRVHWVKPPGEKYNYPFLTVSETANTPIDYADDAEYSAQVDIAVDIFSVKTELKPLKDAVCNAMVAAGFERQTSGPDDYIVELKAYHKTLNFTKEFSM